VFENRVLRKIFGPKRNDVTEIGENYITMRLMICISQQYYYSGGQIKKNEMDGTCGTCGGEERCIQGFGEET
jgi:hypothetical protein